MKKKDLLSLREKSTLDLKKMVDKKRAEFYNSYASLKAQAVKNLKKPKNLRRDISQILTVIREKEIAEEIEKARNVKEDIAEEKKQAKT